MCSRGKQLVQLALAKQKPQQSNDYAFSTDINQNQGEIINTETLLSCNELMSKDNGSRSKKLCDENNNEQSYQIFENNIREQTNNNKRVLTEATRTEKIDFAGEFGRALIEDDGDLNLDEYLEPFDNEQTRDENELSDDLETFPTEINTVFDIDRCAERYLNCDQVCVETSNADDSKEHREPIENKADRNIDGGENENDGMPDNMYDEDFDDSVADPDYDPRKDDDPESSEDEEQIPVEIQEIQIDHEEIINDEPSVKRNKRKSSSEWNRTKQKIARMEGDKYKGLKKDQDGKWQFNIEKQEREMKPRGCSKQCESSKIKSCDKISEIERKAIFRLFWKEFNWDEKKIYVTNLIVESEVKTKKKNGEETAASRKGKSYTYFLRVGEQRYRVCKAMFLNTLGIGEKTAYGWKQTETKEERWTQSLPKRDEVLKQTENTENLSERDNVEEVVDTEEPAPTSCIRTSVERIERKDKQKKSKDKPKSEVRINAHEYLELLPKMESHYCRSTSSKHYLEPVFTTKSELYKAYTDYCIERGLRNASNCLFYNIFEELNLSLYKPRKDQCDKCCEFEVGSITLDEYNEHMKLKDEARKSKSDDKERCINDPTFKVLTMDLQAVLICPRLQASALYYKTKLTCHNFTVMDLSTKDTTCYFWNETEGDLSASSFATCTTNYLEDLIAKSNDVKEVVIYSDGCNYQNRNVVLSNALLKTAVDSKISIVQKYLERGHTQMEVDSIHSLVERKLKRRPIYVPQNYVDVISSCRPSQPLNVRYVLHSFFKDMKPLKMYNSIRPGTRAGDPTVTNLRVLRYNPDGTIQYKLGFNDQYQDFPRRAKVQNSDVGNISQLHRNRIPIKASKFKHLQELKCVVPSDYHAFYDSLPHG